ncbi:MAG: lipopolysaccharide biosynthesis protein [Hyphomicrobium sp.]
MLLRQTLLYLPAQVLGPIVQFLSIVLWTYFLDPVEMGTFALITAAQEFGYIATMFWFTLYTMRYFDRNAESQDKAAFMNTEAGVMLAAALGTALGVMLLPLFIDVEWSPALAAGALAYCLSRTLATHLTDRARTAQDTFVYTIMQVSWPVLGLAFGVLFVELFSATAASVLWGYAVAQGLALAGVISRLGLGSRPHHISPDIVRTGLRYGMPLVIGGLFVWLANNGLRFVIEHQEGAAAVGLVTVGWGLGLRAAAFAAMLVTAAAFPLAVARSRESGMAEGQAQLVRNGVLLLAILAPAAGGLWAISDPLVERIVAAPFREMTAAVLPWAILAGAARNLRIHFGEQVFLLREETRIPLVNDVLDGLSTIVGGAIGLALGGLPGSVAGAACGAIVSLLVTLSCGAYLHGFALPLGHLIRIATATAAMIGALHFLPMTPTVVSLALAIVTGATVYGLALALVYPGEMNTVLAKFRALRQA